MSKQHLRLRRMGLKKSKSYSIFLAKKPPSTHRQADYYLERMVPKKEPAAHQRFTPEKVLFFCSPISPTSSAKRTTRVPHSASSPGADMRFFTDFPLNLLTVKAFAAQ